jgi:hypothetical protein
VATAAAVPPATGDQPATVQLPQRREGRRDERSAPPRKRDDRPQRRDDRGRRQPVRTGAYEKRAAKPLKPITKEMEEGKEAMRTFGDLLQFHRKKTEPPSPPSPAAPPLDASPSASNGPVDAPPT